MNNSKLALDSIPLVIEKEFDRTPDLRQREEQLTKIIEAIQTIAGSKEWGTLKIEIFDELVKRLKRELLHESRMEDLKPNKLNRIAGELKWAEKYSDLSKLEQQYRVELKGIRLNLHGKSE